MRVREKTYYIIAMYNDSIDTVQLSKMGRG